MYSSVEFLVKKKNKFLSLRQICFFVKATGPRPAEPPRHSVTGNAEDAASKGTAVPLCFVSPETAQLQPRLYLHDAADDHGENVEGETEDVEQGQGHEGLLRIQDVGLVNGDVDGKRRQGHLQAEWPALTCVPESEPQSRSSHSQPQHP